jgi:photosystem II stability/assembly factor-like uncharacterized protein
MGPPGGDVRATAADPQDTNHIYLGTADGHVFGSQDAGETWRILGRVSPRVDSVVATMLVDPRHSQTLFAGSWTRDPSLEAGGGIFRSDDGGLAWRSSGLAGQTVRALVQAPSNPDTLVAGTLEGVFASKDFGATWQRISPRSNRELLNIDSLAIDPHRPETIYVGTFHLPWKTTNGGRTWTSIHQGMIDDSDVMSFLVDRTNPMRIFASACSGIYRSDNGGLLWKKVQGIPFSARRTHILAQDSERPSVIYAGTTEGLWRSEDFGGSWRQVTPANWVINSVEVPLSRPGRVVIGTTDLGILVSDDRGDHFTASNEGFNHRQTLALALDPGHPGRVLAVLANGPEPLLVTDDGGARWEPLGKGISNNQLLRVYATPEGWWAALASGGLVRYDATRKNWVRQGQLVGEAAVLSTSKTTPRGRAPRVTAASLRKASSTAKATSLGWTILDMAFSETRWFAASQRGLLVSENRGRTWNLLPFGPLADLPVSSVRASHDGKSLWAASLRGLVFSSDGGRNWTWRDLPLEAGGALRLDIISDESGADTFVATAHRGLFFSRDGGATWQQAASGLPQAPIQDFAIVENVIVASPATGGLYLSTDTGRTWSRLPGTIAEGSFSAVATQPGATAVVAASSDGVYSLNLKSPSDVATHP